MMVPLFVMVCMCKYVRGIFRFHFTISRLWAYIYTLHDGHYLHVLRVKIKKGAFYLAPDFLGEVSLIS